MTADQKKAVLDQLDRALHEFTQLRAKSQYDDCSDQPDCDQTRVITLLGTTIDRIGPPGSRYRTEADRIFKMLGATNPICLRHLPGIIAALRSDVDGDYLQSVAELIHADLFSDFLGMAEHLLDEGIALMLQGVQDFAARFPA